MDRCQNHRPPSSVRSSVNSASFNHVPTTVTPPASPPSYPSGSAHLPHPSGQWPLSPPSTRTSVASATHTKPNPATPSISDHGSRRDHTNAVIEAANLRVKDEQDMQNMLHSVQLSCQIWNPEIEPEHETTNLCECAVHKYWKRKVDRLEVQEAWSKAVIYPGEKPYHDCTHLRLFNNNPYTLEIGSPYGFSGVSLSGSSKPDPQNHLDFLNQTIALNESLDAKAKIAIQAQEPSFSIWDLEQLESWITKNAPSKTPENADHPEKSSRRASFKKVLSVRTSDERAAEKIKKKFSVGFKLREDILKEEEGRWQNDHDRQIVAMYQQALGIASKVQELRAKSPCQYLHLLRAGYFEPLIWNADTQASTPLRFSIDSAVGWRGITPAWRAFENTAEERLYWVLSNRDGGGVVLKPDIVSALDMARTRMSSAVEIPPVYHYPDDTCHVHLTSQGYSKQVKSVFRSWSTPMSPTDETMILLDVSGSMDFSPARPNYNKYLITGFVKTSQPKNKELAKAIINRFMKSMESYDNHFHGYPLVTFSSQANDMGLINQLNIDEIWNNVKFGGRTRIMTGWSKIKQLHFQKHFNSSQYHSVYGWQPGVDTPNLRALVILDGEASDMDEFELELLSLSWAYVTIFLIGIEGSLNHHRHANRLQRMSEVNPRISYVEAQGNASERFILHELLKRHLGRDLSMAEFRHLEHLPTELPSPVHIRQEIRESTVIQLEQVPVELPSLEETRHWQVQHHQRPATPVAELRADRDPVELPATPRRYTPFPPPERFNFPLPLPLSLSRPRPLNGEQSPQSPPDAPPPYFETA